MTENTMCLDMRGVGERTTFPDGFWAARFKTVGLLFGKSYVIRLKPQSHPVYSKPPDTFLQWHWKTVIHIINHFKCLCLLNLEPIYMSHTWPNVVRSTLKYFKWTVTTLFSWDFIFYQDRNSIPGQRHDLWPCHYCLIFDTWVIQQISCIKDYIR